MSYVPGDMIIVCLDELGQVVIRGIQIDNETYEAINVIYQSEHNGRVTKKPYWTSIEDFNSNRLMRYKCVQFLEDITTKLLSNIFKISK